MDAPELVVTCKMDAVNGEVDAVNGEVGSPEQRKGRRPPGAMGNGEQMAELQAARSPGSTGRASPPPKGADTRKPAAAVSGATSTTSLAASSSTAPDPAIERARSCSWVSTSPDQARAGGTRAESFSFRSTAPAPAEARAAGSDAATLGMPPVVLSKSEPTRDPPASEGEVERLRLELAQTQLKLKEATGKLEEWQTLVEDALHSAVFSPEANDRYRTHASHLCRTALAELPQVTRVKYVRCSFPSLRREAPKLRLAKYTSLSCSEWELNFSPSWSMDVCVEVRGGPARDRLPAPARMRVDTSWGASKRRLDLAGPPQTPSPAMGAQPCCWPLRFTDARKSAPLQSGPSARRPFCERSSMVSNRACCLLVPAAPAGLPLPLL
jgi:hypothetical protein